MITERFDEIWDLMNDKERAATAGDLSIYFVERLASMIAKEGDAASARSLVRLAMQLEAIVRSNGTLDLYCSDLSKSRKLH